jgi:hypothetical protein
MFDMMMVEKIEGLLINFKGQTGKYQFNLNSTEDILSSKII